MKSDSNSILADDSFMCEGDLLDARKHLQTNLPIATRSKLTNNCETPMCAV